jgi:hypothetical protein
MFVEQLIKNKEENMISGLWGRMSVFSLFWPAPLLFALPFSLSFYMKP